VVGKNKNDDNQQKWTWELDSNVEKLPKLG
jgi:hypothetical protein